MEVVRRLVWLGIVCIAAGFAIFTVLGNFVVASAENAGPVQIRDTLAPGVHHLSGMLLLPLTCDQLTVQTDEISSNTYLLDFGTWQDPTVACETEPTPRQFNTIVLASSVGVQFTATLDGKAFPISILPTLVVSMLP
jgi:hypothetical protein